MDGKTSDVRSDEDAAADAVARAERILSGANRVS